MGLSAVQRKRLQEIAGEAKKILGVCSPDDGRPLTFSELEDECIEAGDFFTSAMLEQHLSQRPPAVQTPRCPTCDRPGVAAPDEPRVLQTDRGEVTWMEPTYNCRHCRRSFFPSLG